MGAVTSLFLKIMSVCIVGLQKLWLTLPFERSLCTGPFLYLSVSFRPHMHLSSVPRFVHLTQTPA